MGSQSVKAIKSQKQRKKFVYHLLNDVKALEKMIENDVFEKGIQRVGAEQELCLTKKNFRPSKNALKILEKINDKHFTTELALFNLEINLDPVVLTKNCFSSIENQLTTLLNKAHKAASEVNDNKVLLTGILPTLKKKDLIFENMTPLQRYKTLNDVIKNIRRDDFKLRIDGVDELIIKHDSILFEACNTSFQVHLQLGLDEIVDKYNWAQAIAGPVLSVMTNSPLLLNRELWAETRIALFKQSIDLRTTSHLLREQKPRVSFGNDWVYNSIIELFTDDISRYAPLVTSSFEENSIELFNKGIMPQLKALNLHNGTLYKWNRLCYGVHKNVAHLRIENRYIPSGPSVKDEIANALFWVGVMQGMPDEYKNIWKKMHFKDARGNFINAARTGMDTYFNWFNKGISAKELALDTLIPMARKGLLKSNVNAKEIDFYLGIIEKRIINNITGSKWQVRGYRKLREKVSRDESTMLLTYKMYKNQRTNTPIHQWEPPNTNAIDYKHRYDKIYKAMTTELFVVNENDLVELVGKVMEWKKIRHLPVMNESNKITGLITKTNLLNYVKKTDNDLIVAKDFMIKNIITVHPEISISEAKSIMKKNSIGCLPVVDNHTLVGIFTENDLKRIEEYDD